MNESNIQQPVLVYPQYPINEEDEISLFEIWRQLAARKTLIFIITVIFFVVSAVAVLFSPKMWQAEIQFMPPELKDIQGLNIQNIQERDVQGVIVSKQSFKQYTPDSIYKEYLDNYQSIAQKRQFFNQNKLLTYYGINKAKGKLNKDVQTEKAFEKFNEALRLNLSKKKERALFIKSTLVFPDQKKSNELLNQYAKSINIYTRNRMLNEVKSQILLQKKYINDWIISKKKVAHASREDRIAVLDEAIKIARLLNIKEGELQFIKGNAKNNPINKETSLYYQGFESLEAEKKVLQERKSDIPFIPDIRKLEEQAYQLDEQLERLISERDIFSAVRIDQKAVMPKAPFKPKRKLIIAITTIFGFFISLLVVFFLNLKQKYKEEYSNT